MASTTWLGITTDATLDASWSNGVPDSALVSGGVDAYIGSSVATALVGFGATRALGTLTTTGVFSDGEEIVIDAKTYTMQTVLTDVDGNVLIGASASASLTNLESAITLGSGAGTTYAASMTAHATCTGSKLTASTFRAAALDAGAAGNSLVTTTDGGNASWGAGTLLLGAATGAIINNIWLQEFDADLSSSGAMAEISFNKITKDGGTGVIYVDVQNGNRVIIDGDSRVLAASLKMTSDVANSIEVISGHCAINWNGLTGSTSTVWIDGPTASCTITGTGTVPTLILGSGRVTTNGPTITTYACHGGRVLHSDGAITTLYTSAGDFELNADETVALAYIVGGSLTTTQTLSVKTITTVWVGPSAVFDYQVDTDVIGVIRMIGQMGEF